ncbi:MAG: DUF2752 domain-containing protein [Planctomycetota bacterium]
MDAGDRPPVPSSSDPAADVVCARPGSASALPDVRRRSAVTLALLLGLVAVASLVEATPQAATLAGLEGPPCLARHVFGEVGCPGCGLTRATAMALDGDLASATRLHPGVWLVLGVAAIAAAVHGYVAVTGISAVWTGRVLRSARVALLGGLLLVWLARLA